MPAISDPDMFYNSPPAQLAQHSTPPSSTMGAEPQLVPDMSPLRSGGGLESRRAHVTSHTPTGSVWSASIGTPTGNDDWENYSLHSSPAVSSLHRHSASTQSSPRGWTSPKQIQGGPKGWDHASGQVDNQYYHSLDPQLSGPRQREDASYTRSSGARVSVPFSAGTFPSSGTMDSEMQAGYLSSPKEHGSSTPGSSLPLSPCNTAVGPSVVEGVPSSGPGLSTTGDLGRAQVSDDSREGHSRQSSRSSPASGIGAQNDAAANNSEEPYAKLIYRALKSSGPPYAMTLQEIYQWFRDNTDKDKYHSKGWQNSIRHNLSMNQAFTKRDRKSISSNGGDAEKEKGSVFPTGSQIDSKRSTEWCLEPWAVEEGVQSTTRYRKGTQSRRSAARHKSTFSSTRSSYGSLHFGGGRGFSRFGPADRRRGRMIRHAAVHSAPAATASHIQRYHFAHHHNHPQLLHGSLSDPSPYAPYFANGTTSHLPMVNLGLEFQGSQVFQSTGRDQHQQHHHHHHQRARSEPTIDEPVTPEPPPYSDESALPLPDLRSAARTSSSNTSGLYYTMGESHSHHHHGGGGLPMLASYAPGTTYEDVYVFGGLEPVEGLPYQPHAF